MRATSRWSNSASARWRAAPPSRRRSPGSTRSRPRPLVSAAPSAPEQQGRPALRPDEPRATAGEPLGHGLTSRDAERNATLLVALADDPQDIAGQVDVVDVEPDEFTDPDAGRVEQFESSAVAQVDRVVVIGCHLGDFEQGGGRTLGENRWQGPVPARRGEAQRGVGGDATGALEPAEERAQRRGGAGDAGAGRASAREHSEPRAQVGEGHLAQPVVIAHACFGQERLHVAQVGPHGVHRAPPLGAQVALERWQRLQRRDGHGLTVSPHPSHPQHGARHQARGVQRHPALDTQHLALITEPLVAR